MLFPPGCAQVMYIFTLTFRSLAYVLLVSEFKLLLVSEFKLLLVSEFKLVVELEFKYAVPESFWALPFFFWFY